MEHFFIQKIREYFFSEKRKDQTGDFCKGDEMSNFIQTLKTNFYGKILIFTVVFYFCMYASKTIHPLWFEENHALAYFGVSYSVMAVAGTFSFFTGFLSDRIGPTRSIRLGIVVYAAGLFLRIYTHSVWIVAASGFIAGLGASLVIICMRHWVVSVFRVHCRLVGCSLLFLSGGVGGPMLFWLRG
jgi:MFS family permease